MSVVTALDLENVPNGKAGVANDTTTFSQSVKSKKNRSIYQMFYKVYNGHVQAARTLGDLQIRVLLT